MNPDRAFESWLESLSPGDPVWHTDGHQGVCVFADDDLIVVQCAGAQVCWPIEDVMQPETTPFHMWATAQGEGE